MKEHPILFSGEMVRAILDGRKTQTRRVLVPQPDPRTTLVEWNTAEEAFVPWNWSSGSGSYGGGSRTGSPLRCPYGVPGDLLWVRETWAGDDLCGFVYRADHPDANLRAGDLDDGEQEIRAWRSPRFMPRCASRIALVNRGVRVGRVRDISTDDVIAEGIHVPPVSYEVPDDPGQLEHERDAFARDAFATVWNKINRKRAPWATNPWVWVVDFELVSS